jgi:hypothetical protein
LSAALSAKAPRGATADVNGIEAFPVEVEVNCGWGDTVIVIIMLISPISRSVCIEQKYGLTLLTFDYEKAV